VRGPRVRKKNRKEKRKEEEGGLVLGRRRLVPAALGNARAGAAGPAGANRSGWSKTLFFVLFIFEFN
jgi:hypothetical protein